MNQIENVGMNKSIYFFDTYAFFEIIRGNPSYSVFTDVQCITTIFNIAELNYNIKKQKGKKIADDYIEEYKDYCVAVTFDDIKKAMDLKVIHKNLSIPDAIGYIVAMRYNLKFLTGDEGFKNMDNVVFVK